MATSTGKPDGKRDRHVLGICLSLLCLFAIGSIMLQPNELLVIVNDATIVFTTSDKFFSFALDSAFVNTSMRSMTNSDWDQLVKLSRPFAPAFLRLGGTDADKLVFNQSIACNNCDIVNMTPQDWLQINEFVKRASLSLIFDFNVMLRNGNSWDSRNAKNILAFTKQNNFQSDFQLGNEPNSFLHVFNYSISPEQLGNDFKSLRNILNSDDYFKHCLLVGPDITRPKILDSPSVPFLKEFLTQSIDALDAVTWHHYYFNGRNATAHDFVDPLIMNVLRDQIRLVSKAVREVSTDIPIWLGETGSAYGGGAPGLSDRFASTFLLLDKIGLSALHGIQVVIRQSLYKGHYAMIDNYFDPNPDFWVSLLYKQLVGQQVFVVNTEQPDVRMYAHSAVTGLPCAKVPNFNASLVVFGMNVGTFIANIHVVASRFIRHCGTYVFTSPYSDLSSSKIQLNGKILNWTIIAPRVQHFARDFVSLRDDRSFAQHTLVFNVYSY